MTSCFIYLCISNDFSLSNSLMSFPSVATGVRCSGAGAGARVTAQSIL